MGALFLYNTPMKIIDRKFLETNTRSCHASTIALWKGHPVFSWFGGSAEGAADVSIYLHNLNGNGKTITIGDKDSIPRWNPILVPIIADSPDMNKLYLFEKAGAFCDRWQTFIHDVTDWNEDITSKEIWGHATSLPAGINGPVKTAPIFSSECSDLMLCGSSFETFYDWSSYIEFFNVDKRKGTFYYSGRSNALTIPNKTTYQDFSSGKTRKSLGIIQPAIFELINAHAFFRSSHGLDRIYYSRSCGFGWTASDKLMEWSDPIPTNLENPNSGIDVATIKKKGESTRVFLAWNPSATKRSPLVISELNFVDDCFSLDMKEMTIDIKDTLVIRDSIESEHITISKELSYPYLIADEENNLLHLVYTYGRSRIEHVTIEI